jgi:ribose transport system permease protein
MSTKTTVIEKESVFKKLGRVSGLGTLIPILILFVFLSFSNENFLTTDNILAILRQAAVYAIMAVGMTFAIITGGIDLAHGSMLAFAHVICAYILNNGEGSMVLAILAAIAVGCILGAMQGSLIAFVGIPPFIVTMGFMNILRGMTLVITDAQQIQANYEPFRWMGTQNIWIIPVSVILFIIVGAIGHFILSKTATGRYVYALGSNEAAAKLSGVNTSKNKVKVYTFSGACVGFASVVYLSRLGAAQPTAGLNYEMEAIASTVIGGTSIAGGEGGVIGSLLGAIFVAMIRNGMIMLSISTYYQQVVIGAIIIIAVTIDLMRKRIQARKVN